MPTTQETASIINGQGQGKLVDVIETQPKWIRVKSVREYAEIPRATLYREIKKGTIKTAKIGGIRLIDLESVHDLIANHTEAPA